MSRCLHCQRQKGKRTCPALGGAICSVCCGTHRLKAIACPSDCVWLGGLAIVRDDGPVGEFGRGALDEALGAVARYSSGAGKEAGRPARRAFFGDDEPRTLDEWEQALFVGYLLYGYRGGDGKRLVDRYAESRARDLGREAALALRSLLGSWASLFEVLEVHRGAGVTLRNLLAGETTRVSDVTASSGLERGDWLFAWLLPVGERVEFVGTMCSVPEYAREAVLAALRAAGGGGRDRGALAPVLYAALGRAVSARPLPRLVTGDGEEMIFCRAYYAVRDEPALRGWLGSSPQLDRINEDAFVWLDDDRYLGRLDLAGGELVLETNSRQRLERGKQLLAQWAHGLVEHRLDSVEDVTAAMRARPEMRSARDDLPEELQAEMTAAVLRQHYATWADVALPALDGMTPRQAARDPERRDKVRALVDEIERGTLAQPGGETVDFDGLRQDLGLDDEELEGLEPYDAGRAPDAAEWLARDEDERMIAVKAFHRGLEKHPPMPNARMHAIIHVVVENQLALGEPRETRAAMERLCAAGLSRHEALHAVGQVVAESLAQALRGDDRGVDRDSMAASLMRLQPGDHAGSAPR